jgi:hypothetical protein
LEESTSVDFGHVSREACRAFRKRSNQTGIQISDIINWCLAGGQAITDPHDQFYWCPNGTERVDAILIPTDEISGTRMAYRMKVKLTEQAQHGLRASRLRYKCTEAAVFGRAAALAPYFKKKGGKLLFGQIHDDNGVKRGELIAVLQD